MRKPEEYSMPQRLSIWQPLTKSRRDWTDFPVGRDLWPALAGQWPMTYL